jgi:hypothetical protein
MNVLVIQTSQRDPIGVLGKYLEAEGIDHASEFNIGFVKWFVSVLKKLYGKPTLTFKPRGL